MTSCHQGLSPNNKGRQWRESLGTRLEQKEIFIKQKTDYQYLFVLKWPR